jgi:hypothetical protein
MWHAARYNLRVKRFRRRIFDVAAAISLLLDFAMGALWVRTLVVEDFLAWDNTRSYFVVSGHGAIGLVVRWGGVIQKPRRFIWYRQRPGKLPDTPSEHSKSESEYFFGLGALFFDPSPTPSRMTGGKQCMLVLFDGGLILVFAVLPFFWRRRYLRRQKLAAQGHCAFCGYDLRATPGLCPECGRTPAIRKGLGPNLAEAMGSDYAFRIVFGIAGLGAFVPLVLMCSGTREIPLWEQILSVAVFTPAGLIMEWIALTGKWKISR